MVFKLGRRKRLTLLKCVLIGIAISGVMFWLNQVWSVSSFDAEIPQIITEPTYLFDVSRKDVNKIILKDQIDQPFDTDANKNALNKKNINDKKNEKVIWTSQKRNIPVDNALVAQISPPQKDLKPSVLRKLPKVPLFSYKDKYMKVTPGLGENGAAVILSAQEQKLADEVFNTAAFNVYISDRIALNRTVPDPRNPLCKSKQYDKDLPNASVVIIYTNEAWSALLRTVYSVVNRSPTHILHEIILVDDYSDREELKNELRMYINHHFPHSLIKMVRLPERRGLIRARLAGARIATGDVLVFLDSHCEVNSQWLEPMLQRIKEDPKAVLCPIIDVIDDRTLEYYANNKDYFQVGGFTWSGHFTWIEIPEWEEKRRKSQIDPTRSPTMAGGLFAIDRNYFWKVGSYDSGMDIWGGENLEMSFRVWLCGGKLEIIPCSHVGHIFRSFHPYVFPGNKDSHGINTVRTVEVWMEEYKKYFYMFRHDLKNIDFGDISARLQLKKELQCKPFKWYLENIYPQKFMVDQKVSAYGIIRNPITNLCLDVLNRDEDKTELLGLYPCKQQSDIVMNQMFSLSNARELRREENCAAVNSIVDKAWLPVSMAKCTGEKGDQEWLHTMGGPIIHVLSGKCLDVDGRTTGEDVFVADCSGKHSQLWWFENYTDIELEIQRNKS